MRISNNLRHRPGGLDNFIKDEFMLLAYLFYRFAMPRYFSMKRYEDESWLLGAEAWVPVVNTP